MKGVDLPEFRMMTAILILLISLRWSITLLKQRSFCEVNEIAEILSIVNVKVFYVINLFDCIKHGSRERIAKEHKFKEMKDVTLTRDKSFLST